MEILNKIYVIRSSKCSLEDKSNILDKISRSKDIKEKISPNFLDDIFYKTQLRVDSDFERILSFDGEINKKAKANIVSLNVEELKLAISKKARIHLQCHLNEFNKVINIFNLISKNENNPIIKETKELVNIFNGLINEKASKLKFNYCEQKRKTIELLCETRQSRFLSARNRELILEILKIMKIIINDFKISSNYKKIRINSAYLVIGKTGFYSLILKNNKKISEKDNKIITASHDNLIKSVYENSKKICGLFDSTSSLFTYIDLNEYFGFEEPLFQQIDNDSKSQTNNVLRLCFAKFSVAYNKQLDDLFKNELDRSALKKLKDYYNLYSAAITYYRSYSVDVLAEELGRISEFSNTYNVSIENISGSFIKNYEKNECINFLIDDTTFVYAVSQSFTQDIRLKIEKMNKSYKTMSNYGIENINYDVYRRRYLTAEINSHEYRYYAEELAMTVLSSLIYFSMCLKSYYYLQIKAEEISRIKNMIYRLFKIHKCQKLYSEIESCYKADSIYSKIDKQRVSNVVCDQLHVSAQFQMANDVSTHLWHEANTSNGKYGDILSFCSFLLSLISVVVCGVTSFLCLTIYNAKSASILNEILIACLSLLPVIILLMFGLRKKK